MAASNAIVADLLRRYGAALVMEKADRFKVKAYRRAADTIETLDADIGKLARREKDLLAIPGIGKGISAAIREIVKKGKLPSLDAILARNPPSLAELAALPRLDPTKVTRIYRKLGICSIAELRERLERGEIRETLGARMDFHVRQGLDERPRLLLHSADSMATRFETFLIGIRGVTRASPVGSLRRKKDTIGDLNFLFASKSAEGVFRRFGKFGGLKSRDPRSDHERTYSLPSGVSVTLSWTPAEFWGFSSIAYTGSTDHIVDLQRQAARKKLMLSVEGFQKNALPVNEEIRVYRALGLDFIEPELREGGGEVQAAAKKNLPQLVKKDDIRGDLHMHTTASDGANSIAEMAAAARQRGYEYIAITDHSQSLKITNGLSEERLFEQIKAIDAFNAHQQEVIVLKSAEVDILQDGSLDYSDAALKELDFTICSIHSRFGLNKQQQTERIMRAMDNPYFNILGHATGRLLLKREGYELDIERLFKHAKATGCYFEINSSPDRLDLSDEHAHLAKEMGIRIAVNTDAHSVAELDFMKAGLNQARRGWLEANDVLNTLPLRKLIRALRR